MEPYLQSALCRLYESGIDCRLVFVPLQYMEGEPENQPLLCVLQIYICDLLNAFQAVEERASVYKKCFGGLENISFQLQKRFQRMI